VRSACGAEASLAASEAARRLLRAGTGGAWQRPAHLRPAAGLAAGRRAGGAAAAAGAVRGGRRVRRDWCAGPLSWLADLSCCVRLWWTGCFLCCTLRGRQLRRPAATKARARLRAAGKSLTAPLDRVKLLLQTRGGLGKSAVAAAARGGGVLDALAAIGREEGLRGYWKGNLPQARCCVGVPAWLPCHG